MQDEADLPPELRLAVPVSGQTLLTLPGQEFYRRVIWDRDGVAAAAWKPADSPESTVTISPLMRFGKPAVGGVATEVLWEQLEEGATPEEVADDFGVTIADVRWAQVYEISNRAAA